MVAACPSTAKGQPSRLPPTAAHPLPRRRRESSWSRWPGGSQARAARIARARTGPASASHQRAGPLRRFSAASPSGTRGSTSAKPGVRAVACNYRIFRLVILLRGHSLLSDVAGVASAAARRALARSFAVEVKPGAAFVPGHATGVPLAVTLTGGHRNDVTRLIPLLDTIPPIRGAVGRPWRRPRLRPRRIPPPGPRPRHHTRDRPPTASSTAPAWARSAGRPNAPSPGSKAFRRHRNRTERRAHVHQAILSLACSKIICPRNLILTDH